MRRRVCETSDQRLRTLPFLLSVWGWRGSPLATALGLCLLGAGPRTAWGAEAVGVRLVGVAVGDGRAFLCAPAATGGPVAI